VGRDLTPEEHHQAALWIGDALLIIEDRLGALGDLDGH
jgi:hypothetical protein